MGAGFAELFLDGVRSGGQTVPHSGRGVHADAQPEPQAKNFDAPGGVEPRRAARAGGEENARTFPLGFIFFRLWVWQEARCAASLVNRQQKPRCDKRSSLPFRRLRRNPALLQKATPEANLRRSNRTKQ